MLRMEDKGARATVKVVRPVPRDSLETLEDGSGGFANSAGETREVRASG